MKNFIRYCVLTLILLLGVAIYKAVELYQEDVCDDELSPQQLGMYKGILKQATSEVSTLVKHAEKTCIEGRVRYDARMYGIVPPVRERLCESCWAYAALGILECSYLKVNKVSPKNVDFSEKQVILCARNRGIKDSCKGSLQMGLSYLSDKWVRVMPENRLPDRDLGGNCPKEFDSTAKLKLREWGWVDQSRYNRIASVEKIKEAICLYGPIATSMNSSHNFLDFDGKGVFFERRSDFRKMEPGTNHVVIIIGWDDDKKAWLVRNCWGPGWAINGYAWVSYYTSNIGVRAAWVIAWKTSLLRL